MMATDCVLYIYMCVSPMHSETRSTWCFYHSEAYLAASFVPKVTSPKKLQLLSGCRNLFFSCLLLPGPSSEASVFSRRYKLLHVAGPLCEQNCHTSIHLGKKCTPSTACSQVAASGKPLSP